MSGVGEEDTAEEDTAEDEEATEEEDTEDDADLRGAGAVITLADCVVESSKDISYIAYLSDGETMYKDESMGTETYDLSQVEGIEDVEAVQVKSSTTVEEFSLDGCDTPTTSEESDAAVSGQETDTDTEVAEDSEAEAEERSGDEVRAQSAGYRGHGGERRASRRPPREVERRRRHRDR